MKEVVIFLAVALCLVAAFLLILPFWTMFRRERLRDQFLDEVPKAVAVLRDVQVEDTCSICLEPFHGTAKELQCQHHFHAQCLTSWWSFSTKRKGVADANCPVCRRKLEAV